MKKTRLGLRAFFPCVPIVLLAALSAASSTEPIESPRAVDRTVGVGTVLEIAIPPDERPYTPRDRGLRRVNRPLPNPERFFSKDRTDPAFRSVEYIYLRFDELPDYGRRWVLRGEGILLTDYAMDYTYIAAVNPQGREFLNTVSGITDVGPIPLEDKVEAKLLQGRTHTAAIGPSGQVLVDVVFHRTVTLSEAHELLEAHGGTVLSDTGFMGLSQLSGALSQGAIETFAGADLVANVFMKRPGVIKLNQESAAWSNTEPLWSAPYSLSGAGLNIGLWDVGAIHGHPGGGWTSVAAHRWVSDWQVHDEAR